MTGSPSFPLPAPLPGSGWERWPSISAAEAAFQVSSERRPRSPPPRVVPGSGLGKSKLTDPPSASPSGLGRLARPPDRRVGELGLVAATEQRRQGPAAVAIVGQRGAALAQHPH